MMIAIPDEDWAVFRHVADSELLTVLRELSAKVKLSAFRKHPRGPKKPAPKRISSKKHSHVSTAKILAANVIKLLVILIPTSFETRQTF
jgi:hypothetical protein